MDGKKKKNNKKKKGNNNNNNNHGKVTDDVPSSSSVEQVVVVVGREEDGGGGGYGQQQVQIPKISSETDIRSVGVSESDVEVDRHNIIEEKFLKLQEEVSRLEDEKSDWLQKEARLDEKIKLLQSDVDSCIKKEANLEEKLKLLENRNDSFAQKEAVLEDRVTHIEGLGDSSNLKDSIMGMDSKLDELILRLQEQVKELIESRDFLAQENTQLKEILAVMESRVQRIETEAFLPRSSTVMITERLPEETIPNIQSEAAPQPLLEKLNEDKIALVEKEVHIESHQIQHASTTAADRLFNTTEFGHVKEPSHSAMTTKNYTHEYGAVMNESGEEIPSFSKDHGPFDTITNGVEEFGSLIGTQQGQLIGMDNSRISDDVVLVPLDDGIHVQEPERPQTEQDEVEPSPSLPLSDAPLIGAPFRLISFFAKYVSGADLVQPDTATSG